MKGTIRERPNRDGSTSYLCQVFEGRDPVTQRRLFKTGVAKSKRAAHALIHTLLTESGQDRQPDGRPTTHRTLGELIEEWLRVAGPQAVSTRSVYDGYLRAQILPFIGDTRLDRLRVDDLDRWYALLRDQKGLKPSSIRKAHTIVRGALAQGVRWGWVPINVAALVAPPIVPKPVIATPKPADVKRLVEAIAAEGDLRFATYVRLSGVTGGRPGEMCALQWRDVDFDDRELHLRRRVMRSKDGLLVEDLTKTGKTRTIPLDAGSLRMLAEHRGAMERLVEGHQIPLSPTAYVFSEDLDGSSFARPDCVSRRFRLSLARVGLSPVTLYSLRHQAATAMIDRGVDAKTVSERLGNSVATVLTTYTRARTEADAAAAELMGSLYD